MKKIILIILLFTSPVWGATYYVDRQGDNTNCNVTGGGSGATGCSSITNLLAFNPPSGSHIIEFDADDTFDSETLDLPANWTNTYTTLTIRGDNSESYAEIGGGNIKPIDLDFRGATGSATSIVIQYLKSTGQSWDTTNQPMWKIGGVTNLTASYFTLDGNMDGAYPKEGLQLYSITNVTLSDFGIYDLCDNSDGCNQTQDVYGLFGDELDGTVTITRYDCENIEADCAQFRESEAYFQIISPTCNNAAEECFDLKGCDSSGNENPSVIKYGTFTESAAFSGAGQGDDYIQLIGCGDSDGCAGNNQNTANWVIEQNYFGQNYGVDTDAGSRGVAFNNLRTTGALPNNIVRKNFFDGLLGPAVLLGTGAQTAIIENNVMILGSSGYGVHVRTENNDDTTNVTQIRNNSIYGNSATYGIYVQSAYGDYVKISNNLVMVNHASGYPFYSNDLSGDPGLGISYNYWWNPSGNEGYFEGAVYAVGAANDEAAWNALSEMGNDEFVDPGFHDVSGNDLSLDLTSNSIDDSGGTYIATEALSATSVWYPVTSTSVVSVSASGTKDPGAYENLGASIMGVTIN